MNCNDHVPWYSKSQPIYVFLGDRWFNERNNKMYVADLDKMEWVGESDRIPFPPKCKICVERMV